MTSDNLFIEAHTADCLVRDGLPCSCRMNAVQSDVVRAIGREMQNFGLALIAQQELPVVLQLPEVRAWCFDIDRQLPVGDTVGWPRPVLYTLARTKEEAIRYLSAAWAEQVESNGEGWWPTHMSPDWSKTEPIQSRVWIEQLES